MIKSLHPILLLLMCVTPFAISQPTRPQLVLLGARCYASDNITINGTYHTKLLSLLSNLPSESSRSKFSVSSLGAPPSRVNALFLCRADIPLATCHACVDLSVTVLQNVCGNKKEAILWFDECFVRYSNRSVSSMYEEEFEQWSWERKALNVSQPSIFPRLLSRTMGKLIDEASSPNNTLRFAAGKANYTLFEGLYGLALCTSTLTASKCRNCLTRAFRMVYSCCGGLYQGTRIFLPSCQIRYDTAPFLLYDLVPPPSLAAPASSPSPSAFSPSLSPSPSPSPSAA